MRCAIIALLTVLSSALFGQTRAGEPIRTSLCELVRDPERFNNKLVEIRSEFVSRFQWEGFVDETCSAKIKVSAYGIFDDVRAQDGQTHLPVDPKQDDDYRAFRKYSDAKFKWPDGGRCQDCPLYRILVTADGRFDYFAGQTVAARANPAEKVGISDGESDVPLLRFVPQSVSDVSATPIDTTLYSEKKRRDVTLEEAHELVTAFLRGRRSTGFSLDKYENKDSPGFQFFQVLGDDPYGSIHYAVDRKTGDVWSEAPCKNLTSPSVKKLQQAIRNRIGLTADELRKARRRGPYCDQ
jgi:hypothetical protein